MVVHVNLCPVKEYHSVTAPGSLAALANRRGVVSCALELRNECRRKNLPPTVGEGALAPRSLPLIGKASRFRVPGDRACFSQCRPDYSQTTRALDPPLAEPVSLNHSGNSINVLLIPARLRAERCRRPTRRKPQHEHAPDGFPALGQTGLRHSDDYSHSINVLLMRSQCGPGHST